MPLTINSNISSLNAQRRLAQSTGGLQRSFERLSSGLRINRSSDDAAGLAIASSLSVDSRVYTQAVRNTNDAVSFYGIAEGALTSLVNITTRLKELAQQSSNGVLSSPQRKSLDAEAQALGREYQRIRQTTQFNGQNLLDNSVGALNVQVAYSALSLSGGNAADGTFAAAINLATGIGPNSVATADLNGDGIIDLVSADLASNQLSVFMGNGDGTFQAARTYAPGNSVNAVTTADVNGDRIADLIAGDQANSQVSVLLGNGNGSFRVAQTYAVDTPLASAVTGDFNGDGNVDLAFADYSNHQVDVLIGNGNGSFRAKQAYASSVGPTSATTTDVNGDGIADLISANTTSHQLGVLIGNGNGTFNAGQTYAAGFFPVAVTTGDLNGDGIADLISAGSVQLSVLIGNGNGTFRAEQGYDTGDTPYSVSTADVNGDGVVDLVSAGTYLAVLIGNGNGSFRFAQTYSTGINPRSVKTADFNGDGFADLVTADSTLSNRLSVFLGNGASQAVAATPIGQYSLLSLQSSLQALTQFDQVLNRLTASLGQVGANESRLQTITAVLQQTRINFESAASQIRDVDVAGEAANLAKGNILQQAGAAVLAQANQQPGLALQLLRNF